jgi:hypothetical protein
MKATSLFIWFAIMLVAISCQRRDMNAEIQQLTAANQRVVQAVEESNADGCTAIREFRDHWPGSKQDIGLTWDKESNQFIGKVVIATVIEGRFVIKLWSRYEMDKGLARIQFDQPELHFYEFQQIVRQAGGGVSIRYNNSSNRWLKYSDWLRLKAANWDFSSLGISIISNSPIPGVEWVINP